MHNWWLCLPIRIALTNIILIITLFSMAFDFSVITRCFFPSFISSLVISFFILATRLLIITSFICFRAFKKRHMYIIGTPPCFFTRTNCPSEPFISSNEKRRRKRKLVLTPPLNDIWKRGRLENLQGYWWTFLNSHSLINKFLTWVPPRRPSFYVISAVFFASSFSLL